MKILILGGSGFIGSHVVDALLAKGHGVRIYDRVPERFRPVPSGVEFIPGEFADTASLAEALAGVDMVFHLVSTTVPPTAHLDPIADVQGNLINTIRLMDLMRAQGIKRLLYLSSGGTVYGVPTSDPVPESHALNPVTSYGIVKVAVENYIRAEQHLHGLKPVILRPSNPYGPRQGHGGVQGVIGTFMWRVANGEGMQLWGDGSIVRDFVHVRDLAELCVACAEQEITGTFNAGAGEGHSIRQVLEKIADVSGLPVEPELKPGRDFDVPRVVLDVSAVQAATGWAPRTGFHDGLAETWNWVLARREEER